LGSSPEKEPAGKVLQRGMRFFWVIGDGGRAHLSNQFDSPRSHAPSAAFAFAKANSSTGNPVELSLIRYLVEGDYGP
jgi:hypothetical protein